MLHSPALPIPSFRSPGASFEQPFDMLLACHERVERSLALLERLLQHACDHGWDAMARSAAIDVLRYFDVAAPLHHQDEEQHVFPRLAPELAQTLLEQHRQMERLWAHLRLALQPGVEGDHRAATAASQVDATPFIALYRQHAALEEAQAFPSVRKQMLAPELAAMGEEMSARRHPLPLDSSKRGP